MASQTTPRTARRFALTLAVAGTAAFGTVAVAPAAFAADSTDGSAYTLVGVGDGNGPDAFVVTTTGRIPVFFCEDVKPGKDGAQDPKDVAKAVEKAAKEAQKAADEVAKDADKVQKKAEQVDRVMKQHNICLVSPTISRF